MIILVEGREEVKDDMVASRAYLVKYLGRLSRHVKQTRSFERYGYRNAGGSQDKTLVSRGNKRKHPTMHCLGSFNVLSSFVAKFTFIQACTKKQST